MRKIIWLVMIFLLVILISSQSFGEGLNFSAGINLGGTFPMAKLGDVLKSGILYPVGGYIGLDTSEVISNTNLELGFNYISLKGKNDESTKMMFLPLTLSGLYNFPLEEKIKLFVKVGGGVVFETLTLGGSDTNNTDPIFNFGIGTSHDLSDSLFLRLETIYHFIYEKYQEGATENGNLFSLSLGIGYKF